MREHVLGLREMCVVRVGAGAEAGHALVHDRGRVRHRADDGNAVGDLRFDRARRDRGGDREHGLLGGEQTADLAEQRRRSPAA